MRDSIKGTIQGGIIFILPFLMLWAMVQICIHFFRACYILYLAIKGRPRSPKNDREAYYMKYGLYDPKTGKDYRHHW